MATSLTIAAIIILAGTLLSQALAISSSADITDEASAIERLGLCPRLVRGDASNFKVTYAQDIRLAAALLSAGQN